MLSWVLHFKWGKLENLRRNYISLDSETYIVWINLSGATSSLQIIHDFMSKHEQKPFDEDDEPDQTE